MNTDERPKLDIVPQLGKLPDDLVAKILSFLDAASLVRQRSLNRSFRRLASDTTLWQGLCYNLWKDKIHVEREARDLVTTDAMAAYRRALEDAQTRDHMTREELCYDPTTHKGTIWSLRFKEAAGPDWTSWDPWWNHQLCRKIVFLEDGRVKMFLPSNSNDSEQSPPDSDDMDSVGALDGMEQAEFRMDAPHVHLIENQQGELDEPSAPMTWRFITDPLDLPSRPVGSYIRLTVGGRDVPTYCCRRSPTGNWGFVLESCWGVCASFELPPRPRATQRGRRRRRLRRAHNLAGQEIYLQVEVDDSSEDDELVTLSAANEAPRSIQNDWGGVRQEDLLVTESSFNVTISLQWREAFLYNVGEDNLPEGPNAIREFQRVYENTMADR